MKALSIKKTVTPPNPFKKGEYSKWASYIREGIIELSIKNNNQYVK